MKTIVLGLGNPILSDDSVGIHVVRDLRSRLEAWDPARGRRPDVVEAYAGGIRLIELLRGYDRALIVDAMVSGRVPHGTVQTFEAEDFGRSRTSICVHDMDFATALEFGRMSGVALPKQIRVWAVEARDIDTFKEQLSPEVQPAVQIVVDEMMKELDRERILA